MASDRETIPTPAPATPAPSVLTYPGARRPDRSWRVDSDGLSIAAHQWGEDRDPLIFIAHGGFDFAGTLDGLAARLADAGQRVVSWDQRGHGDSDHAALYSWDADLRDAVAVMASVTTKPAPLVGHSKGGGLMMALADMRPDLLTALANLDGLPSTSSMSDMADRERKRMMTSQMADRLDFRRRAHDNERRPGTIEELATRRAKMNPRLDHDWLRYLVTVGAREDADGWRWKLDPTMRFGGMGPYRPEWALSRLPGLRVPFLGVLGTVKEEMGWGTNPGDLDDWLPVDARFEVLEDVGHFVHIEKPDLVASFILELVS